MVGMNWKNTWYLIGATIGLFAFIFFYERHLGKYEPPPPPARLAPGLDVGSVSAIEVIAGDVTNRVELRDARWRLVQPLDYPAEKLFIDAFLKTCEELVPHASVSAQATETQPRGVADYGFDPPQSRITITQRSGDVVIEIGRKSPDDKWVYVRADGTDGVEIVDANFLLYIPWTSKHWRDRTLVELDNAPFDRLAIRAGSVDFELSRSATNSAWSIERPPPAKRADHRRVTRLIQALLVQRVNDFVTDDPKADLELYGLKTPSAELSFSRGAAPITKVQFGSSPTNLTDFVYARRLSHTNIVLVPKALVTFLNEPFSLYRDQQLLSFAPETIQQIDIKADEGFTLRRQTNNAWTITQPIAMPADSGLVGQFMTNLMMLQVVTNGGWVKDVVADYSQFGLAPPQRSYSIFTEIPATATNAPFATIAIGRQPTNEFDTVLARRLPEEPVYKISLGEVERLPKKAFMLRDRRIWDFDRARAQSITIRQDGKTLKLIKGGSRKNAEKSFGKTAGADSTQWVIAPGSSGIIHGAAVEAQVLMLSQLRAQAWSHQSEDLHFLDLLGISNKSHTISIEILENGKPRVYKIRFGKKAPPNVVYAAVTLEGGTTVFQYSLADYQTIAQFLSIPKN